MLLKRFQISNTKNDLEKLYSTVNELKDDIRDNTEVFFGTIHCNVAISTKGFSSHSPGSAPSSVILKSESFKTIDSASFFK